MLKQRLKQQQYQTLDADVFAPLCDAKSRRRASFFNNEELRHLTQKDISFDDVSDDLFE